MSDSRTCGCCEGTQVLTPVSTANRPGLPALSYRVGTHATFLETMKARLSSAGFPELAGLKTRDSGDPSIALLDAWSLVSDILTFYQERIANEGYVLTATERRSILELARLTGYTLRPGVASSVYLAYTLDEDKSVTPPKPTATTIPKGSRAQSVPGPGEMPQSFETSEELGARSEWNNLQVRLTQPQTEESIRNEAETDEEKAGPRVYLKGISTNLKLNDPLLIDFGTGKDPELFRVMAVEPDAEEDRTLVKLQEWSSSTGPSSLLEAVNRIVDTHIKVAEAFSGPLKNMAKAMISELRALPTSIADLSENQKADFVERQTLKKLTKTISEARPVAQKKRLVEWLNGVVTDLSKVVEGTRLAEASVAGVRAPVFVNVVNPIELIQPLVKQPSLPPGSSGQLVRDLKTTFTEKADSGLQMLSGYQLGLRNLLPSTMANAKVTKDSGIKVYALRVKAAPFGHNAQKRVSIPSNGGEVTPIGEWPIVETNGAAHETNSVLQLDTSYDKVLPGSWIVVDTSAVPNASDAQVKPASHGLLITRVKSAQADIARADYGMSGKTTLVQLAADWLGISATGETPTLATAGAAARYSQQLVDMDFQVLRKTAIYTQSEELPLAEEPISDDICEGKEEPIELDGLYSGLLSGRWLIVCGQRADIQTTDPDNQSKTVTVSGVMGSELAMLAGADQAVKQIEVTTDTGKSEIDLPGDKTHTFIRLASPLSYCYKRDTVIIYGNVVKATHGETRSGTLGGGDGSKSFQEFTLKQPPLTFIPASNPSGVESTLVVRVNDVQWHEEGSLAGLLPNERKFVTRTDNESRTTVIFGDGVHGSRLPTGQENVKAVYRSGIGKSGNVKAEQVTLLVSRPLNVKEVTNPQRASGGADKEGLDQARQNAPLAVTALDRLVSTEDYADFVRTFAGIGKASALRLSNGRQQLVHVTIAGADDIPIDESSDLYQNLVKALHDFGDPDTPIQVDMRELLLLVIQAKVRVLPDYIWEKVEPQVRAALLDKFSFARRDLGQDVFLSEAFSTIQAVEGVEYVDVENFDALDEESVQEALASGTALADSIELKNRIPISRAYADSSEPDPQKRVHPAQFAYFSPDVPDTIILNENPR
jgi:hypothetical protein